MRLVSVNVGLPRLVTWHGEPVMTGIFKEPVAGRVKLRTLNLEGDGQADLSVHGGRDKAVYIYPSEHYSYWRNELPNMTLPYGMFGENFTTEGVDESSVRVGDRFQVGTAQIMVTKPRQPCYKLGIKFNRPDIIKRFHLSGRTGFYVRVLEEGEVGVGDTLELIGRDANSPTISERYQCY